MIRRYDRIRFDINGKKIEGRNVAIDFDPGVGRSELYIAIMYNNRWVELFEQKRVREQYEWGKRLAKLVCQYGWPALNRMRNWSVDCASRRKEWYLLWPERL